MRKSKVLAKLRDNRPVLSTSASFTSSSAVTEMLGMLGFDCIWIDMEHRAYTEREVFQLIQGARAADIDTFVRIRKYGYCSYFRPLEDGASGIMVPHCMSAEEARWAVRNAKFAPQGLRGFDDAGPDADYLMADSKQYFDAANRETFVILQIEDREAIDRIDEIASVDGVDILFVGPGDLTQSYGVRGQCDHACIRQAKEKVAAAAKKYKKHWGLPVASAEHARPHFEMGARFFNCGSDIGLMLNGYKAIKADFEGLLAR